MQQLSDGRIQVAVVVGHAGTRERKRAVAKRGPGIEIVRPGASEPGSLHLLTAGRPEVLILDVRLPEVNGDDIGADLRTHFPRLEVIVLSGYDHVGLLQALVKLGAEPFRGAACDEAEIMEAARTAVDRRCLLSAEMLLARSEYLPEPLTVREYETLRLMAAGRHNREIGDELGISLKTVEFHICHVMEKLGVHGRVEAILRARELSSGQPSSTGAA
ncbi:MAG: response regulator transcription factor [Chloroflexota bacterium]